jgi:asparagine synthase (glutamine-hydrolysing)
MCGIAGIYSHFQLPESTTEIIQHMIEAIRHRGPDEKGFYVDDHITLGQSRLSIIDLSSGSQPIHNENRQLWIVFNGEIFNYIELRESLLKKGHQFYTSSDTEVILHLFEDLGPECVQHLNGQFAFAIWDSHKRSLFLARDRVGIRPIYYTKINDQFIFGSEIKAIFQNKMITREIDPKVIQQIFTFWTPLPGQSIFKNVHEVKPGHYLVLSNGQIQEKAYWDIPFCAPESQSHQSFHSICEELQELLFDAVRIRLRADVPVGSYLSGGIDSSLISSIIARKYNHNLQTYGIRFQETAFDEGSYQNKMVSFLRTNHHKLLATNSAIQANLPKVIYHCEQPILRTAPVPLFLLSKKVNEDHLKVVLTGEGADEIFGGYNIFKEAKIRHYIAKNPQSKRRMSLIGKLYPYIFNDPRSRNMMQTFFSQRLDEYSDPFFSHQLRWQNSGKMKLFFADTISQSYNPLDSLMEMIPSEFDNWDYLSKAQYLEVKLFLSQYLLSSQGDRMAMANSLEIRLPYLDFRQIMGLNEKYLLKKAFPTFLPEEVIRRPKNPYRAPIKQSLFQNHEWINDNLSQQSIQKSGLFNYDKVSRLIHKVTNTAQPNEIDDMTLIGILSSQLVYDQFIATRPARGISIKNPETVFNFRKAV